MQYGHFDDEKREYVITRPDTPRPWSNYLGSTRYGAVITNHAGGYTFYRSAKQGRLTRFRFNAGDQPGKTVYLHDAETHDYWANAWQPVPKPLDEFDYVCRHGTGYTIIASEYRSIACEVTYFAPLDMEGEVWKIVVENRDSKPRKIRVFPFVEYGTNWNADDDMGNLQYTQYVAATACVDGILDRANNVNMPTCPEKFQEKDQARHTFMALAGATPAGFDCDLEHFLGRYGRYHNPDVVVNGACTGSIAIGDNPCGVFQVDCDLAPGERKAFAVVMGIGKAGEEGPPARAKFDTEQKVDAAFAAVVKHNHDRLGRLSVNTPDAIFNSMINVWSPYNCLMTFYWSRTASLVYAGERDGLGFRDSMQDMLGAMAMVSPEAGKQLELLLTGQLANGGALPVVKPFAHEPGKMAEPDHYRADDCLWFFNAVPEYVKETGEIDFYRKVLPYADQGEATVLGHLRRAMEFNFDRLGAHGLPCGLHADWNDCLRLGSAGESLFVAFQLRLALREYIDIATRLGEQAEADWATGKLAEYDATLAEHAWDGDWYLRAYRYDGLKFGSAENDEGRIFMNPNAWAVISGHADADRGAAAMDAVHEQLATEYGVMLCTPPYIQTDPKVALAVLFNPGMKENGAIFNHTQGWAVIAEVLLGRADRAWEYYRAACPATYNDRAEEREVEPYVVCQSTHSRFSPRFGKGRCPWLSGSATWNQFAATEYLLGIRPEYDGLRVEPCIPATWPGFTAMRVFRGKTIHIEVRNPDGVSQGVATMEVDGKAVDAPVAPVAMLKDGSTVTVTLG